MEQQIQKRVTALTMRNLDRKTKEDVKKMIKNETFEQE
jgi:hypothetical protein